MNTRSLKRRRLLLFVGTIFAISYFASYLNFSSHFHKSVLNISMFGYNNETVFDFIPTPESNISSISDKTIDTDWLLKNPRITVNLRGSNDSLPSYFNLSTLTNLTFQFDLHHDQTKTIMDSRRRHVEELCKNPQFRGRTGIYYRFNFRELKLSWCPIFKAGSTNWKQFFCRIMKPDVYNRSQISDSYCELDVLLKYHDGGRPSFTFTSVRHPYERLVSAFEDRIKNCKNTDYVDGVVRDMLSRRNISASQGETNDILLEEALRECKKPIFERNVSSDNPYMNPMGPTFKEFLAHVIDHIAKGSVTDFHWYPMHKVCNPCTLKFNAIEKMETYERDHYYILKSVNQEHLYPYISESHLNPSSSEDKNEKLIQHFKSLDEQMLWDLYRTYEKDFIFFDYVPHFRVNVDPYTVNNVGDNNIKTAKHAVNSTSSNDTAVVNTDAKSNDADLMKAKPLG